MFLHRLATLPANTDRPTVDELTKALPADLQTTAWKLYRHHNADLVQVDNLNQQAEQAFNNLLAPLDTPTQDAFRQLVGLPDVLTALTSQLDKTTQLGQQYQADPEGVTQRLTALHDSMTHAIGQPRIWSGGDSGFFGAARSMFGPVGGAGVRPGQRV